MPLLRGEDIQKRPLYWHYPHYGNQGGEPSSIIMEGKWKLIHYHEDGRDELYDLNKDIGEKNDLIESEAKRAQNMRRRLEHWLQKTKATLPTPDPEFEPEKRMQRWENIRSTKKEGLEKQHAKFLEPGYKPNKDWWGSSKD